MPYGSVQVPAWLYQADGGSGRAQRQGSGVWICPGLTVERMNPMPEATELLHSNLHEVFFRAKPGAPVGGHRQEPIRKT